MECCVLPLSCALQIGGVVTPHDGQCHLRRVTSGGETYHEYNEALRLVRHNLSVTTYKEQGSL